MTATSQQWYKGYKGYKGFSDQIIYLALFQLTEVLIRVTNFFEFE